MSYVIDMKTLIRVLASPVAGGGVELRSRSASA